MKIFSRYSVTTRQRDLTDGKKEVIIVPGKKKTVAITKPEDPEWIKKFIGQALPKFRLKSTDGKNIDNKTINGKITVFSFWHLGCKTCVTELPRLNDLVKAYEEEEDIIFLAPTLDGKIDLKNFLKTNAIKSTVLTKANSLAMSLDISVYPTFIVVDKSGKIIKMISGVAENTRGRLDLMIEGLLKKN